MQYAGSVAVGSLRPDASIKCCQQPKAFNDPRLFSILRITPRKRRLLQESLATTAESRFMTNRGAPEPLTIWPVCGGDDASYTHHRLAGFHRTAGNIPWNAWQHNSRTGDRIR